MFSGLGAFLWHASYGPLTFVLYPTNDQSTDKTDSSIIFYKSK